MKALNAISNGMKKFAHKRYILPLVVLFIIVLAFMERGPFGSGKFKEMSGGAATLDMTFGYTQAQAYGVLDRIGGAGRELYGKLLGLDYLFAVVYMGLQSLLVTALIRKAKLGARWEKLNLLPIVRSALDVIENCLLLYLIMEFPMRHVVAVSIVSAVTLVKLAINYGYIAIIFALGALATRQSLPFGANRQNRKEMRRAA